MEEDAHRHIPGELKACPHMGIADKTGEHVGARGAETASSYVTSVETPAKDSTVVPMQEQKSRHPRKELRSRERSCWGPVPVTLTC